MEKGRDKRIVSVLMTLTIIFTLMGGTLSYLRWQTSEAQKTNVVFTVNQDFSCAADGGGNIQSATLMPASCTNPKYAIQRTVTVTPTINRDDLSINMDLWLDINTLGSGLSRSEYFKYALTTEENSCTTGIVSQGRFTGLSAENKDKVMLLNQQEYSTSEPQTYYLYIWIDPLEENNYILEQPFNFSLGGSCTDNVEVKPSKPELDPGMIPVTISDTGVVTTISENDNNWYDYSNKEWANVVLVNSSSRSTYQNTTGKPVSENDILAYYVWIPRYKYLIQEKKCSEISNPTLEEYPSCYSYIVSEEDKTAMINWWYELYIADTGDTTFTIEQSAADINNMLQTGNLSLMGEKLPITEFIIVYNESTGSNVTYDGVFNGNNIISGPNTIDIYFESKDASIKTGDAVNTYRTHPSFIWDGKTIGGIWVGKFETTGDGATPTIKPNTSSLLGQNVSTQFTTSLRFAGGIQNNTLVQFDGNNTYGLTNKTDSHMLKNSDWGAVAYLSHSKYGINEEIRINNYYNSGYKTGCGALTPDEEESETCGITYGTPSSETHSYPQSTTGNITGIFDMSGGALEYVMGVLSDLDGNPRSGFSDLYNSGFTNSGFNGIVYNDGNESLYTSGITFPERKYYDMYLQSQFYADDGYNITLCTIETCGGHALKETYLWYNTIGGFVSPESPWFVRGGYYGSGAEAGAFNWSSGGGYALAVGSWRSVLVVEGD